MHTVLVRPTIAMLRTLLVAFVVVAAAAAQRSPNADLVEDLLRKQAGPSPGARYSNNIVQDALLDVPGLVRRYNYPLEVHNVVTSDGYIVTAHRIPHGRDANNVPGTRPIALVVHGLMCSSADFLVLGPGNALAYLLAEEGYDVWLANARGNYYSRRHLFRNPNDSNGHDFWKFSWDEIGNRDLPALINHITSTTGQEKMHYIGYSQGTTVFLVLNSLRPEFNDKFISFQALAPAVYVEHNENRMREIMVQFERVLENVGYQLGFAELMGSRNLFTALGLAFCNDNSPLQSLCVMAMGRFSDVENINATMLPVFLGHTPAGAALRQIIHYSQVQRFKRFARYNHGSLSANLLAYGSATPPAYNVSLVNVPTHLHYGLNDVQADPRDVLLLKERLGGPVTEHVVPRASFNHFDFIWAGDVKVQLYDKIISLMRMEEQAKAEN